MSTHIPPNRVPHHPLRGPIPHPYINKLPPTLNPAKKLLPDTVIPCEVSKQFLCQSGRRRPLYEENSEHEVDLCRGVCVVYVNLEHAEGGHGLEELGWQGQVVVRFIGVGVGRLAGYLQEA